tara:strand:- start:2498 stop:2713 length:216 start_codon:yes stop_codon:yes gene_type:complete
MFTAGMADGKIERKERDMAKIISYIPEPKDTYDVSNQRQIIEAISTTQQQLNFSYQQDLKNEQDAFNYFLS